MLDKGETSAVGGWLHDFGSFRGRGSARLSDVPFRDLDPDYLAFFEEYRQMYFFDRLLPDQGAENILRAIQMHGSKPSCWADIGAGVTTLFWSIGVDSPGMVVACDLIPEALTVLSRFRESDEAPQCYFEAMALLGVSPETLETTRRAPWEFCLVDCFAPWTLPGYESGFDLVTVIGCLGLARDEQEYSRAFSSVAANVRKGGSIVGADWVRSESFVRRDKHDNSYVSGQLARQCGDAAGLSLSHLEHVPIKADPNYAAVLVWAFTRRGTSNDAIDAPDGPPRSQSGQKGHLESRGSERVMNQQRGQTSILHSTGTLETSIHQNGGPILMLASSHRPKPRTSGHSKRSAPAKRTGRALGPLTFATQEAPAAGGSQSIPLRHHVHLNRVETRKGV